MFDKLIESCGCEDFAIARIIWRMSSRLCLNPRPSIHATTSYRGQPFFYVMVALDNQVLYACHLISSRPVVACDFCLDDKGQ